MQKQVIIITGATGSGKSALAIEMAIKTNAVIVNADAMQIYQDIPIITAQPDNNDKKQIDHYLYGFNELWQSYSVGKYLEDFEDILKILNQQQPNKNIIVVGGTAMYIDALINGINKIPIIDVKISKQIRDEFNNYSIEQIYDKLKKIDPLYASFVDKKNRQRIIRGIEVKIATNKSIMDFWQQERQQNVFELHTKDSGIVYNIDKYLLLLPREQLYQRIDARFDEMLNNGLLDEVLSVKKKQTDYLKCNQTAIQLPKAIGLQYLLDYLDNKITLDIAVEFSKRDSRHYAKRQLTWFKNKMNDFKIIKNEQDILII